LGPFHVGVPQTWSPPSCFLPSPSGLAPVDPLGALPSMTFAYPVVVILLYVRPLFPFAGTTSTGSGGPESLHFNKVGEFSCVFDFPVAWTPFDRETLSPRAPPLSRSGCLLFCVVKCCKTQPPTCQWLVIPTSFVQWCVPSDLVSAHFCATPRVGCDGQVVVLFVLGRFALGRPPPPCDLLSTTVKLTLSPPLLSTPVCLIVIASPSTSTPLFGCRSPPPPPPPGSSCQHSPPFKMERWVGYLFFPFPFAPS